MGFEKEADVKCERGRLNSGRAAAQQADAAFEFAPAAR
jgi:hypothetical protein